MKLGDFVAMFRGAEELALSVLHPVRAVIEAKLEGQQHSLAVAQADDMASLQLIA